MVKQNTILRLKNALYVVASEGFILSHYIYYFYNKLHLCTFILRSNYDSLCFMFGNAWLWVWNTGQQNYVMWVTELHQILQYSVERIVLFNKGLMIAKEKFSPVGTCKNPSSSLTLENLFLTKSLSAILALVT